LTTKPPDAEELKRDPSKLSSMNPDVGGATAPNGMRD